LVKSGETDRGSENISARARAPAHVSPLQLSLFDTPETGETGPEAPAGIPAVKKTKKSAESDRALEEAQDQIRRRFGKKAITRGTLLHRPDSE